MASVYDLKPAFQARLRPLVSVLARAGATPNLITIAAVVVSIATGAAIALYPSARWPLWLLPPMLFVRMALNALDGMMARDLGLSTRLGAALNECGDVISDVALYAPLARVWPLAPVAVAVAVLLSMTTEIVGAVPTLIGWPRRYDGPMGKSDRAVAFGLIATLVAAGGRLATWAPLMLAGTIVLLGVTVMKRATHAEQEAHS